MATPNTNKVRTEPAAVPAHMVETQRDRIFQAMSMIATVNKVLLEQGEVGDESDESPLWFALRGVHGLLDDIAAKLDVVALRETSHHVRA